MSYVNIISYNNKDRFLLEPPKFPRHMLIAVATSSMYMCSIYMSSNDVGQGSAINFLQVLAGAPQVS
jgi:hypothetical protein